MMFQKYEKLVDAEWVEAVFEKLEVGDIIRKEGEVDVELKVLGKPIRLEGENWGIRLEIFRIGK